MKARIEALGDRALQVSLDAASVEEANRQVHALFAFIDARRPPWIEDLVPAYTSLAVILDPDATYPSGLLGHAREWIEAALDTAATGTAGPARIIDIPVCYGGSFGPDLADWARHGGFTPEEGIARHTGGDYRVAMLGFAPGFPYLMGLDPALAMPRLATPRARIPAGSVGIGGGQTGVYPAAGPGGWRLLGRTPLRLFDPGASPPALLAPGDRVRFVAIDRAHYDALGGMPE